MRPRLTYAHVMATIAVFIALGGASYAAVKIPKSSVGAKQLKNNAVVTAKVKKEAITGAKVKKGTLTGTQIDASTLGTVPSAQTANTATTATTLKAPEPWHVVGAPGEPQFQSGWKNDPSYNSAAFYKDQEGIVHLRGGVEGGTGSETVFQLPVGYRPLQGKQLRVPIAAGSDEASILVIESTNTAAEYVSGAVYPVARTEFNLDGVSFRAEG